MKIKNDVLALVLGVASVLLITTGCSTVIGTPKNMDETLPVIESKKEPSTLVYIDNVGMSTRIVVSESKENKESKIIANRIQTAAESGIIARGFSIYSDAAQKPEIVINLNVDGDIFDKSGNYYVVDSSVSGSISTFPGTTYGRLVEKKIFPVTRGDRVLGLDKAYSVSADKASALVSSWLTEKLTAETLGVGVANISIRRRALRTSNDPKYLVEFIDKVSKVDGIYSCIIIEDDKINRTWKMHIVYDIAKFPAGVLNVLLGVKDLNLERSPTTLF